MKQVKQEDEVEICVEHTVFDCISTVHVMKRFYKRYRLINYRSFCLEPKDYLPIGTAVIIRDKNHEFKYTFIGPGNRPDLEGRKLTEQEVREEPVGQWIVKPTPSNVYAKSIAEVDIVDDIELEDLTEEMNRMVRQLEDEAEELRRSMERKRDSEVREEPVLLQENPVLSFESALASELFQNNFEPEEPELMEEEEGTGAQESEHKNGGASKRKDEYIFSEDEELCYSQYGDSELNFSEDISDHENENDVSDDVKNGFEDNREAYLLRALKKSSLDMKTSQIPAAVEVIEPEKNDQDLHKNLESMENSKFDLASCETRLSGQKLNAESEEVLLLGKFEFPVNIGPSADSTTYNEGISARLRIGSQQMAKKPAFSENMSDGELFENFMCQSKNIEKNDLISKAFLFMDDQIENVMKKPKRSAIDAIRLEVHQTLKSLDPLKIPDDIINGIYLLGEKSQDPNFNEYEAVLLGKAKKFLSQKME